MTCCATGLQRSLRTLLIGVQQLLVRALWSLSRCNFVTACRLVGLAGVKHFEDFLGKEGTVKKGGMRSAAAASHVGPIQHTTATHLGDGQPLMLSIQVRQ